ncbi:caspase domain-containing protein [Apiospora arundinis]|uniref:Caspase domain-containing protein n=1 Tax=Apiospora arundinis TaxID=335852 RepID=A0ABR2HZR0_9PEZI
MPTKYALLVGVDLYVTDGSRTHPGGKLVSLPSLQGAMNDVREIKAILRDQFDFDEHKFTVLTSSPPSSDSCVPHEPENKRPTHANIKGAFEEIHEKAKSGDVFFFHFSGHGALLPTTLSPPADDRPNDASLMTADYCCGKPAIRGWELNEWLRRINEKNVRVIVLLDSCYSGGVRCAGTRFRSPENWTPPPNLPADEEAAQGTQRKPGHRDGDLGECWDINPKDFALMAACQRSGKAAEKDEGGAAYGAFTLALTKCLRDQSYLSSSTYHDIRERTAHQLELWDLSQKPQVFGRDRLAFLEGYEPFVAAPIAGTLQEGHFSLPIGKVHGTYEGAEFITISSRPNTVVSISEVNDRKSKALVQTGSIQGLSQSIKLIPYRWSAKETLEVLVDPNLGQVFRTMLKSDLEKRIAGDIQCPVTLSLTNKDNPKAIWFRLGKKEDGGIDIFGPALLSGEQGPVRGWTLKGETDEDRARESAIALAHLFRFGQILHLQNALGNRAPFQATVKQAGTAAAPTVDYKFQNLDGPELHFAVLILSPGFHVKQLFPVTDTLQAVPSGGHHSFQFRLTVPDKLRRTERRGQQYKYRDVIRTVVTRGKGLSLRSVELPDIWNAAQWDEKRSSGLGRDGELLEDVSWWIQDDQKVTS